MKIDNGSKKSNLLVLPSGKKLVRFSEVVEVENNSYHLYTDGIIVRDSGKTKNISTFGIFPKLELTKTIGEDLKLIKQILAELFAKHKYEFKNSLDDSLRFESLFNSKYNKLEVTLVSIKN